MKILCELQLIFTSFSLAFIFFSMQSCNIHFLQEPQLSFKDTKRFLKRGQLMRGIEMMTAGLLRVGVEGGGFVCKAQKMSTIGMIGMLAI